MPIQSVNPATNEVLASFEAFDQAEVQDRLNRAKEAFQRWRTTSFAERSRLITGAAEVLESDAEDLARMMAIEMGKPLRDGRAEVLKSARGCRYYAENGENFLRDEPAALETATTCVRYEPMGPVLSIMPWNFPFWQVFRFAAPALMGGNVALLKHAPNVPQCALAIEGIFNRAGFPKGVFQNLFLETDRWPALSKIHEYAR